MIQFLAEEIEMPGINKSLVERWIRHTAAEEKKRVGRINYIFCNDKRMLAINKEFLQHDYYTDIITFDYSKGAHLSADIFISIDTIKSNAEEYGVEFDDELHRVMVHGLLHLCGYNDERETEQTLMRQKEDYALARLQALQNDT